MAGDKVVAQALVAQVLAIYNALDERFDDENTNIRTTWQATADGVVPTGYILKDLKSIYTKLNTRVNAMQDSP